MSTNNTTKSGANKFVNTNTLPTAISLIVIGVLFCIFRSGMLNVLFTVVGVVLIILGIIKMVNRQFAVGGVDMAIGIIIIVCGWTILDITLLIVGVLAIVYGIYQLGTSIEKLKRAKGYDKFVLIVYPLIIILVGILLVVSRWQLSDAIFITLGVIAVIDGVLLLAKK